MYKGGEKKKILGTAGSETSFDIGSHMDFTDRLLGHQLKSDPIWISPISCGGLGCGVDDFRCKSEQALRRCCRQRRGCV